MKTISKMLLGGFLAMASVASASAATFIGNRDDFRDETIYFLMTTRFYDGDPSNNTQCWNNQERNAGDPAWRGDFKGLIEKLDYIKALGFTAIWITPVVENASGYDYHGYHASNFSRVDHRYESGSYENPDVDFQDLIDAVHAKGMKLVLDIVLNHTGNFGEENLCKLFNRDWNANQADIDACMIPLTKKNGGRMPDDYSTVVPDFQYAYRLREMKNTDGENHDTHNYWHHYGNFNWDDDTRWWAQIAGDCVDLNTENQAVVNYLLDCYGKFIRMGVDGFRIDTSGHISRLTFNKMFIPQFHAIADEAASKAKRNNGPFFMFGEVCARDRNVAYRGQDRLSPYFYTWKETKNYAWDTSTTSWDNIVVPEGGKGSHTNVTSVDQHAADYHSTGSVGNSKNALLNGNEYHTPDWSQHSGFNVIDFPMHWNFRSANEAWSVKSGDHLYNDASYNVVYVDSHDYAPDGAPESTRFAGDQSTWAENMALMFTFRGIPCIYYGSEIEFKKGKDIDKGPNIALRETGRAYYGGYIKGNINVTDFGQYNGQSGNIAATLSHPLAQHVRRLNLIRAAVPALRKGQYSTEGCTGSFAFKRRYVDDKDDSFALVCISGGATFTGIPNGTYTDCVTGDVKTVSTGSLTASCSGKGNMRVYVLSTAKTAAPGKIGTDGKYLYASASTPGTQLSYDGTEEEDSSNNGGSTPGGGTPGGGSSQEPEEAIDPAFEEGEMVAFFENNASWSGTIKAWVWNDSENFTGGNWPGQACEYLGNKVWKWKYNGSSEYTPTKIIFSAGPQTKDLDFVNGGYYNSGGFVKTIQPGAVTTPNITVSPAGCQFSGSIQVTLTANAACTAASYKLSNADAAVNFSGSTTITIGADLAEGESVTLTWTATGASGSKSGSETYKKKDEPSTPVEPTPGGEETVIYLDNSQANWSPLYIYTWGDNGDNANWPGENATIHDAANKIWTYVVPTGHVNMIANIGNNSAQTEDYKAGIIANHLYLIVPGANGAKGTLQDKGVYNAAAAIGNIDADSFNDAPVYYNLQGVRVANPSRGIYIVRKGNSFKKVIL